MSYYSSAAAADDPYENEAFTEEQWRQQYYRSPNLPAEQNTTTTVHFRDYNQGEYIHFTRENVSTSGEVSWIYGVITGQSTDIDSGGGKRYPFIYYDTNSNSAIITILDETIMYNQLFHFIRYNPLQQDSYKTIYNVTQVNLDEIDPEIYHNLSTAMINLDNPPSTRTSRASSASTDNTINDNLSFSLPSISNTDDIITRDNSTGSIGGKRYRKKKNKTKRRIKKTKRRNNRKSKRR